MAVLQYFLNIPVSIALLFFRNRTVCDIALFGPHYCNIQLQNYFSGQILTEQHISCDHFLY